MTSAMDAERDKYSMINFEETELRLGLPGGSSSNDGESSSSALLIRTNGGNNKRGFSETTADGVVDLKLNLSSSNHDGLGSASVSASSVALDKAKEKSSSSSSDSITTAASASLPRANDPAKPPAKAQVVGWPPVRSFRKKIVNVQRSNKEEAAAEKATTTITTTATTTTATSSGALNNAAFVKVSVDGAPYLRKVDLKLYKSYKELSDALAKMFSSFTINGNCGSQAIVDNEFMNESKKLMHLLNGSDYVPTYEDKDGDWMLVGDVPWEMFVESCKRLRIVKGSEAIGLAPRAVEKCKN